jgi:DHA1 family tetracycline resistance protein-like MFS transporter
MSRPLLVIFLTIFVNLVGFGIIIPLLPFYARTFGASPIAIGLLFASFSLAQLLASPLLGDLSDRWGRRPVLLLSLIGTAVSFAMLAVAQSLAMLFAARIVDGLSGGNITTARAYIADITTEENRAKAYGILGAGFGLGFIVGPALGAALSQISYTAPIWAAALITLVATVLAWWWLPETVHRAHAGSGPFWRALRHLGHRRGLRQLLAIDFIYWMSFAVYQATFALFGARRFGFDPTHTGYLFSAFGALGVVVQGGLVSPVVRLLGTRRTLVIGLVCTAVGWGGSALTYSIPIFVLLLVPAAIGIGRCNATLIALVSNAADRGEQGRIQGAAGALESLGRTLGPIWGNVLLQKVGEGTAYGAAAALLLAAAGLAARGTVTDLPSKGDSYQTDASSLPEPGATRPSPR